MSPKVAPRFSLETLSEIHREGKVKLSRRLGAWLGRHTEVQEWEVSDNLCCRETEGGEREGKRGRESQKCAWKPLESCLILRRANLSERMSGEL